MKNRTSLALAEQAVMLLVFALAAALCLRAFLWADTTSRTGQARDAALLAAQTAAEAVKGCGGDLNAASVLLDGAVRGDTLVVEYSEDGFALECVPVETDVPGLGRAEITVRRGEEALASLTVCWQEVTGNG